MSAAAKEKRGKPRQQALPRLMAAGPSLRQAYFELIRDAVFRIAIPPAKELEFFIGFVFGVITMVAAALAINAFYAIPVPVVLLLLVLPWSVMSGVFFSRAISLPDRGIFGLRERVDMERADYKYRLKRAAIEKRRRQLRASGASNEETESQLADEEQAAMKQYLAELDHIDSARKALESDEAHKMLGPGGERDDEDKTGK
ncbi:MAG TPA: hypothetical protein VGB85_19375 [Nannocystis sp.]|jgi:hypothetical protein